MKKPWERGGGERRKKEEEREEVEEKLQHQQDLGYMATESLFNLS